MFHEFLLSSSPKSKFQATAVSFQFRHLFLIVDRFPVLISRFRANQRNSKRVSD